MLRAGLYLVYSNVRREMHLSRLKSDFVANVSHELKTPLALIRLFAETLELGRVPSEEKAQQYYRVINKESQRLTQLINNILDFSRIEAGPQGVPLRARPTWPASSRGAGGLPLPDRAAGLHPRGGDRRGPARRCEVDAEALEQALLNLVNNAIKYSRDEKHIRIEVRREGETGLDLGHATTGSAWRSTSRSRSSRSSTGPRTAWCTRRRAAGSGSPSSSHIMEAHGGTVELESAPGQGSTFTLVLPDRSGAE